VERKNTGLKKLEKPGCRNKRNFAARGPYCNTVFFGTQLPRQELHGEETMLKGKRKILNKCSYYRAAENSDTSGIGYCNLNNQTECTEEIQFCENPEILNKHVLEQGLGWQKQKGRNRFKRVLQVIGRLANACWS
jgi:hypothetical protein